MILNRAILPLLFVILEQYEYNKLYQGSASDPKQYISDTAIDVHDGTILKDSLEKIRG